MLKPERQEFILHQLQLHNKVLSTDLSDKIAVSEDTIRRDLSELAAAGKIIKVHGGAISRSFRDGFNNRETYSLAQKQAIARKVIPLIHDGMYVFTTGGTTIIELARMLPDNLQATFITGSLPAAWEYVQHPNIELVFIGDRVSRNAQLTVGADAVATIGRFNADLCILGTNALDVAHGLTDNDIEVAQVKRAMIGRSEKVIALSIAEKIHTVQKIQVCPFSDIDVLVTELDPMDPLLATCRTGNTQLL